MLHKLIKSLPDEGMLETVRENDVGLPNMTAFISLARSYHGLSETGWLMLS